MGYRSFETKDDIDLEKKVVEYIMPAFGAHDVFHTPKFYPVDAAFIDKDGKVTDLIEIKCRNIKSTQYETFTMDLAKYRELKDLDKYVNTYLVVKWQDVVGYLSITLNEPNKISVLKRHNLRCEGDHKLVVELDVNKFVMLT